MTTPSITTSLPDPRTIGRALWMALVATALAVVLAGAFLVGRVTGGSTPAAHNPVTSPASSTASGSGPCKIGHLVGDC